MNLQELKNSKNKNGKFKALPFSEDLKLLVDSLTLTAENNQYANEIINKDSLFVYEPAGAEDKKEGVRVLNYSTTHRKNLFRIYRA